MSRSGDYSVAISQSAQKEIKSLEQTVRDRVLRALRKLAEDPRPPGCRKLVTMRYSWRVRVGDYRIIYSIDDDKRDVEIVAVRHRSKAYE